MTCVTLHASLDARGTPQYCPARPMSPHGIAETCCSGFLHQVTRVMPKSRCLVFAHRLHASRLTTSVQDECEIMPEWAVRAGAREKVYFDPRQVIAAIVTCGGLCPGLNDVVQGLVKKLEDYGVQEGKILGIRCALLLLLLCASGGLASSYTHEFGAWTLRAAPAAAQPL